MQWFSNFKVKGKIICLVLPLICFMLAIGYAGYYAGSTMNDKAKEMYQDRLLPVKWLNTIRANLKYVESDTWQLIFASIDQNRQKQLLDEVEQMTAETSKLLAEYEKTKLDPYELERLPKLKEELNLYRLERKKALDLVAAGKSQEASIQLSQQAIPHLNQVN